MIAVAVVGLQWGDEGKGKIVDLLAADAAHVARFQGGHNAGHTLVIDGQKTTLHLLPSGILQPQSKCYIGNGVVLSPPSFLQEVEKIEKKGVSIYKRLFVSASATLILPYHVALDKARESQTNAIGTTLRGIGRRMKTKSPAAPCGFMIYTTGKQKPKYAPMWIFITTCSHAISVPP